MALYRPDGTYKAVEKARERILDAAETRLLASGPTGLVLESIAADAGVSKGGLLYHFPSKEALVAGLCERMLDGFERVLESLSQSDSGTGGAWTRAYLSSTVTPDGKPADNSAALMAGILATLGRDSAHLETVREHFTRWHRRLEADGIDPKKATIVRLAADGLWLSALLGLPEVSATHSTEVIEALQEMTRP